MKDEFGRTEGVDSKGREYFFYEEEGKREYACSNMWLKEKRLSFFKNEGAFVDICSSEFNEYFAWTPQFGKCEGYDDLFKYVESILNANNIPIQSVDVTVDEMRLFIFNVDVETGELGEEIVEERISGRDCPTYEYRQEESSFYDPDKDEYVTAKEWGWFEVPDEDEEEEEEDEDEDVDWEV